MVLTVPIFQIAASSFLPSAQPLTHLEAGEAVANKRWLSWPVVVVAPSKAVPAWLRLPAMACMRVGGLSPRRDRMVDDTRHCMMQCWGPGRKDTRDFKRMLRVVSIPEVSQHRSPKDLGYTALAEQTLKKGWG